MSSPWLRSTCPGTTTSSTRRHGPVPTASRESEENSWKFQMRERERVTENEQTEGYLRMLTVFGCVGDRMAIEENSRWERRTWPELRRLAVEVPEAGIHLQSEYLGPPPPGKVC